jgi:hypothetical protein
MLYLDFKTKAVGLPLFSGENNDQILQGGWEGRYFFSQKKPGHLGGKLQNVWVHL